MLRLFNNNRIIRHGGSLRYSPGLLARIISYNSTRNTSSSPKTVADTAVSSLPSFNLFITSDLADIPLSEVPSVLMNTTKSPYKYKNSSFTPMDLFCKLTSEAAASGTSTDVARKTTYSDRELGMILYSLKSIVRTSRYNRNSRGNNSTVAKHTSSSGATSASPTSYEEIMPRIHNLVNKAPPVWSAKTVRMALYGCQNMTGDSPVDRLYFDLLRSKIQALSASCDNNNNSVNDSSASSEMKGRKKKGGKALASVTTSSPKLFADCREVAVVLYSLKNFNCEHKAVRGLIDSITSELPLVYSVQSASANMQELNTSSRRQRTTTTTALPPVHVRARDISNSIFGLQKCPSAYPETRNLLLKLLPMINAYTAALGGLGLNSSASTHRIEQAHAYAHAAAHGEGHSTGSFGRIELSSLSLPTAQEIDNTLFGLKSLSSRSIQVQQLIKCIIPFVASFGQMPPAPAPAAGPGPGPLDGSVSGLPVLAAVNVSAALHGLQNCFIKHDVVRELLHTFNSLLIRQRHLRSLNASNKGNNSSSIDNQSNKSESDELYMSGVSIGNALYGLRNFSANYKEVRELLTLLIPYMSDPGRAPGNQYNSFTHTNYFHSPHNISNAIYGLRRMSSDYEEVRAMISTLARIIEQNSIATKAKRLNVTMSPQEVSNTLYGLHSFDSNYIEVKCLLRSLTPYISTCKEPMSGTGVANMLYGLKGLSIQDIEVVVLWNIVTHLMSISPPVPTATATATATATPAVRHHGSSNRNISGSIDSESVADDVTDGGDALLQSGHWDGRFANNKRRYVQRYMKPEELGMAMYGLSNASSDYPEVQEVLQHLVQFIPEVSTLPPAARITSETAVACTIYGFRCMRNCSEVNDLIEKIIPCLNIHPGSENGLQTRSSTPRFNKHHFYMCLSGIRMLDHNHPLTRALMDQLLSFIRYYRHSSPGWTKRSVDASTIVRELELKYPLDIQPPTETTPLSYNPSYAALSEFVHFIKSLDRPVVFTYDGEKDCDHVGPDDDDSDSADEGSEEDYY